MQKNINLKQVYVVFFLTYFFYVSRSTDKNAKKRSSYYLFVVLDRIKVNCMTMEIMAIVPVISVIQNI